MVKQATCFLLFILIIMSGHSQSLSDRIVLDERGHKQSIVGSVEIDEVWAGHPVGFCQIGRASCRERV